MGSKLPGVRARELGGNRDGAIADYREALSLAADNNESTRHAQALSRGRLLALGVVIEK